MSITVHLKEFELGGVQPYGWDPFQGQWTGSVMGHEFTMVGVFKIGNVWKLSKGKTIEKLPKLQWNEKEFWWEQTTTGWEYRGENDKGDLYQSTPGSPTWGGFRQGVKEIRDYTFIHNPGVDVTRLLHNSLFTANHRGLVATAENDVTTVKRTKAYLDAERASQVRGQYNVNQDKMAWLIAEALGNKHRRVPCAALDRPGMAKTGSSRSGGGYVSLASSDSRRRVLQFDLGCTGSGTRFTATQVLETIAGTPTIHKFFAPGKPDPWVKAIPEKYLKYWRGHVNLHNVADQTFTLEDEGAVDIWVRNNP